MASYDYSSTANNSAINNYTYSYNNQLQPKIDKNDDSVWSKEEMTNYATAYKKSTGKTLDVDKLMEKYANGDGVIDSKAQAQMKKDDALGFSVLQGTSSSTSSTSSTTASTSANKATMAQSQKTAILSAVSSYTYEYSGKLNPLLDKDDDGVWNKEELTNYANAYNKATGKKLDVDSLMEKYGKDGVIDPTGQAAMKKDDALGLVALKTAYDSAKTTPTETTKQTTFSEDTTISPRTNSYSIDELLSTMSSSKKMNFSTMINKMDNMSSLLSSFTSGITSGSSLDMFSLLSNRNSLQMYRTASASGGSEAAYAAMSGQLMNFTI